MSMDTSPAPVAERPERAEVPALPSTVLHPHKSFRRKYRKIMVKFEQQMRESSTLFKDQQRLYDISQRIAEQNDQILALLLELNSQPQVPSRLRYDLRDPAIANTSQPDRHEDEEAARSNLRASRHRIQTGEIPQSEYQEVERALLSSVEFNPRRSYASYLKNGPLQRGSMVDAYENSPSPLIGGFLSSRLEETYIQALDDFLDRKVTNPRTHTTTNLGSRHADRSVEREKDSQLRNPVSVYNWLRKNQPQVFLQDGEERGSKSAAAGSRKSKRESMASKATKAEAEVLDEEGAVVEQSATKGKRKRDDDPGYRPKGGHARPTKRRKEDPVVASSANGKKTKRLSMDTS